MGLVFHPVLVNTVVITSPKSGCYLIQTTLSEIYPPSTLSYNASNYSVHGHPPISQNNGRIRTQLSCWFRLGRLHGGSSWSNPKGKEKAASNLSEPRGREQHKSNFYLPGNHLLLSLIFHYLFICDKRTIMSGKNILCVNSQAGTRARVSLARLWRLSNHNLHQKQWNTM